MHKHYLILKREQHMSPDNSHATLFFFFVFPFWSGFGPTSAEPYTDDTVPEIMLKCIPKCTVSLRIVSLTQSLFYFGFFIFYFFHTTCFIRFRAPADSPTAFCYAGLSWRAPCPYLTLPGLYLAQCADRKILPTMRFKWKRDKWYLISVERALQRQKRSRRVIIKDVRLFPFELLNLYFKKVGMVWTSISVWCHMTSCLGMHVICLSVRLPGVCSHHPKSLLTILD